MIDCDCNEFENNWPYVQNFIVGNIKKYSNGLNMKQFSGIIGSAISSAEGGINKNGILKKNFTNAHDYAIAIMNHTLNSHDDKSQNTAAGRFKVMISDNIVRCYIYCWIKRVF